MGIIDNFPDKQWFSNDVINEFISGALGGLAGLVIGHPMDTVKVLMQNAMQKPTLSGIVHVVRQCGMTSFFKGLPIPLYSYGLVNAVTFGTYKYCLKRFDPTERSSIASLSAGAIAATVQLVPSVPVELIKIQQQNTATCSAPAPAAITCMRTIVGAHGIRGLYTGTVAHAFRDIPGLAVYFFVYNSMVPVNRKLGMNAFWASFTAGALSGALSWVVSIPFDVVKTRMQSGNLNSLSKVLKEIRAERNYKVFFRGFNIVIARALLVNSSIFVVYEFSYDWMNRQRSIQVDYCSRDDDRLLLSD